MPGITGAPEQVLCLAPGAGVAARAREDARLLTLIREVFVASGDTYGSPWIHRELGETGSVHRVARLMRQAGLRAQIVGVAGSATGGRHGLRPIG